MMRQAITAAALTAALAGTATACSSSSPDQAACKSAMQQQFSQSTAHPTATAPAAEPGACKGLSQDQLQQLTEQVVSGALSGSAPASAGPANPVPIVKQAGAVTTAKLGTRDVEGDRSAGGDLPGTGRGCSISYTDDGKCLEFVSVTTYADAAAQADGEQRNPPTDTMAVISGDLFDVFVYPTGTGETGDVNTFVVPVSVIAQRVHGQVVQ